MTAYAQALVDEYQVFAGAVFESTCHNQLRQALICAGANVALLNAYPYPPRGLWSRFSPGGAGTIGGWFGANDIKLALCMSIRTFARCCLPAYHYGVKLVYAHHLGFPLVGGRFARWKHWIAVRQLQRHARAVLVLSSSARREFLALGLGANRVCLCPNGFDLEGLRTQVPDESARQAQRAQWGLAQADPLLMVVARLDPIKNIAMILRAMTRLPRAGLAVCGSEAPETQGYRAALEHAAQQLGLADRVIFLGWVDRPARAMACSDLVLLTSLMEQLPNCLVEALAVGVPAIATNVGGIADIIIDGQTGLLTPVDDDAALAQAIMRLHGDPQLRRRIVEAGQRHAAEHFALARMKACLREAVGKALRED